MWSNSNNFIRLIHSILFKFIFNDTFFSILKCSLTQFLFIWLRLFATWSTFVFRNAVITVRNGCLYLLFRVGNLRSSHLLEAHARAIFVHKVDRYIFLLNYKIQKNLIIPKITVWKKSENFPVIRGTCLKAINTHAFFQYRKVFLFLVLGITMFKIIVLGQPSYKNLISRHTYV